MFVLQLNKLITNFCDHINNIKNKRNIGLFRNYTTRLMDKMGLAAGTIGSYRSQKYFSYKMSVFISSLCLLIALEG